MKVILFIALISAFIFDTLFVVRSSVFAGLNLTNVAILAVGGVLFLSEVLRGRVTGKNLFGIKFAIIISFATLFSLIYAQINGVFEGTALNNFRHAKSFVFVPAILYCLPFLIIDTREQGERYLLLLVVVFGLLNIASIIGAQFGIEINHAIDAHVREDESRQRFIGITGNPNKTAYLTCILIAFQYYFYRYHKARYIRYSMAALMVGGLIVVLLSGSRGGLVVLLIVILSLAYRLRDMKVIYAAALAILIVVAVLLNAESTLLDNALGRVESLVSDESSEVTSGRNIIWAALLSDIADSPVAMLFGNGYGSAHYMGIRAEPHNVYFMVFAEFGVIGLGFFIYFIFSMIRYVLMLRARLDEGDALWASVLAGGYVIVFAWIFTTLDGALDLIWLTIGVSMATLLSSTTKEAPSSSTKEVPCRQHEVESRLISRRRPRKIL
jgi:O-antigen ligase